MSSLVFTVHIFKEGDTYVAHVPELDVSSCGSTAEQARANIADAVRGFLEASEQMGTLDQILQEAGYQREGESWRAPEFVALDRLTLSLDRMPPLRPVPYGVLVKLFEQEGFTLNRQRGDHLIYVKPGVKRPLVIPMYS